ncbi:MAG TPA: GAF domain-containing protein, partial [Acidimicrobiales bacterium]
MEGSERAAALRDVVRVRVSGVARVWLLAVAMLATALSLYLTVVQDAPGLEAPFSLPWWALAVLFFITESTIIRVRYRGQGQALALNEIPLVLGLFFASPPEVLLGLLIGSAAALVRRRRQSPLQLAFNTSHFFLAGVLALLAFDQVVRADPLGPLGWSGALLAAVIVTVVGHAAITLATILSGSRPDTERLSQVLSLGVTAAITTTTVALITVGMLWRDQRSALLLTVPVAMGALAYRGYMEQRSKSDTLDLIYESTRMLHRSPEVDSALIGLLTQARTIFRAERAEITLLPLEDGAPAVRTTLGPGAAVEAMTRVELAPGELEWAEMLPVGEPCFYPDAGRPIVSVLRERGITEAMTVAVRRQDRVVATIVVANRIGEANHFDHSDLELFAALTENVAVVLESGTLEQSLQQLRDLEAQLRHQAYHD